MRATKAFLASMMVAGLTVGCDVNDEETQPANGAATGETNAALTWIGPSSEDLQAGDVVELSVLVNDPNARRVTFEVDGKQIAVCDPRDAEEDCRKGATWRWSTTFAEGPHTIRAILERDGAADISAEEHVEVARTLPDVADDVDEAVTDIDPGLEEEEMIDLQPQAASKQSYDPARAFHNVFAGISWNVSQQRVRLRSGLPLGSVSDVARCMSRYGGSIRKFADSRSLSRASIVATAITESGCTNPAGSSDGLSSGPMQVTASTCSAITGLSRTTCRVRMHTQPSFSFDVGSRYMASSYQRRQHRRDPPKIAAAYNAGSIRKSFSNRWHMVSTGNHIDRFVRAYNAYRSWVIKTQQAAGTNRGAAIVEQSNDVELVFQGEHVTRASELPTTTREGQLVFVGDWSSRDGAFYRFEGGAWHHDGE